MSDKKQTAVSWLREEYYNLEGKLTRLSFETALEMEIQQNIAYNTNNPLRQVANMIKELGIDGAIEEYKCKVATNEESEHWKACLKIAKFYKKINQNEP
jgi:hypothetical protein